MNSMLDKMNAESEAELKRMDDLIKRLKNVQSGMEKINKDLEDVNKIWGK